MKKLSISKILLAFLSVVLLNACNKSNDVTPPPPPPPPPPAQNFEVGYLIRPLTTEITSISFNDEQGKLVTINDLDIFPSGTKKMIVSANVYTARLSVIVSNPNNHPLGFSLVIEINGQPKEIKNFTVPALTPSSTLFAEYTVQFK